MSRTATRSILMDLDGTLVDTVPDLASAVNVMMGHFKLPQHSEAQVELWVGDGAERLVRRALSSVSCQRSEEDLFVEGYPVFLDAYERQVCVGSRLYPGVKEGLASLSHTLCRLGCVTNKPHHLARSVLQGLGIDTYFSMIVGGDTLPQKKPDPAVLRYTALQLGTPLSACVMVGDSINDLRTARAANVEFAYVTYGYNHGEDILSLKPDWVIDSLKELRDIVLAAR